jgi:hypothetical protein
MTWPNNAATRMLSELRLKRKLGLRYDAVVVIPSAAPRVKPLPLPRPSRVARPAQRKPRELDLEQRQQLARCSRHRGLGAWEEATAGLCCTQDDCDRRARFIPAAGLAADGQHREMSTPQGVAVVGLRACTIEDETQVGDGEIAEADGAMRTDLRSGFAASGA